MLVTDGHDEYRDDDLRDILTRVKTIAVIGASPNAARPSHGVMAYLIARGYEVLPVNPGHAGRTILDRPVVARLADINAPVDMIDVFRASAALPALGEEILALPRRPGVVWTQLSVRDDAFAARLEAAGIDVVMDRCPKIEIPRLRLDRQAG